MAGTAVWSVDLTANATPRARQRAEAHLTPTPGPAPQAYYPPQAYAVPRTQQPTARVARHRRQSTMDEVSQRAYDALRGDAVSKRGIPLAAFFPLGILIGMAVAMLIVNGIKPSQAEIDAAMQAQVQAQAAHAQGSSPVSPVK